MYQATRDVATETYAFLIHDIFVITWKQGLDSNIWYFIHYAHQKNVPRIPLYFISDFFRDFIFRAINASEMEALVGGYGDELVATPDYPFPNYSYPEIEGVL